MAQRYCTHAGHFNAVVSAIIIPKKIAPPPNKLSNIIFLFYVNFPDLDLSKPVMTKDAITRPTAPRKEELTLKEIKKEAR